jgi:hypothetical protein
MLLHLRHATYSGPSSTVIELLREYTERLITLTDADFELWRVDHGRPEGNVIWSVWAASHQRMRTLLDFTRGDRPLHELRRELEPFVLAGAEDTMLSVSAGSAAQMRSRRGSVADYGRAGLYTNHHSAALARLRSNGVNRGAVLSPLWGNGAEIRWWLSYPSLDHLEAAGHPGPVQKVLESAEIGGHPVLRPGTSERLLLTRLI